MLMFLQVCACIAAAVAFFLGGCYVGVWGMMKAFNITMKDIKAYNARKRQEDAVKL